MTPDNASSVAPWMIAARCAVTRCRDVVGELAECDLLRPFVDDRKAVLHVEYELDPDEVWPDLAGEGFSSMQKRLDLDAWFAPC